MRQDFEPAADESEESAPADAGEPAAGYVAELEQLAQLRESGVITAEDFEAKKKQLLGI
jgi:hypothetical protein